MRYRRMTFSTGAVRARTVPAAARPVSHRLSRRGPSYGSNRLTPGARRVSRTETFAGGKKIFPDRSRALLLRLNYTIFHNTTLGRIDQKLY